MVTKFCCMRTKAITITVLLLLFFLIGSVKTWADSSEDDYLWIEFGERIREPDGTITLPLEIKYGKFPYEKKEISQLDGLRVFYALMEKDDEDTWVFYEANIEEVNGKSEVSIKSFKMDNFVILAEARKVKDGITHWYFAKTSFILFGHSFPKRQRMKAVTSGDINREFEIFTTPQFHYWPQTSEPVRITPLFNFERLGEKQLCIFDENTDSICVRTDEAGNYTYIPPEDRELNRKSRTAFKQVVIVAEETRNKSNYVCSYTLLLHRNRFKNRRTLPGISIFLVTMTAVFLVTLRQRRKFKI